MSRLVDRDGQPQGGPDLPVKAVVQWDPGTGRFTVEIRGGTMDQYLYMLDRARHRLHIQIDAAEGARFRG